MAGIKFTHSYNNIISLENLLKAWKEFVRGKRKRKDVQEFERNLLSNIISLHQSLFEKTYCHSGYEAFNISDPKPRNIHKAGVRDRLLHHAIYRILYPFFDKTFIADSYSCRIAKATHKAINRFHSFVYQVSENGKKTVWILKCDIRKFFDNIDHKILLDILKIRILDQDIVWLLKNVIHSFSKNPGKGLPLGNLTSQLFVNIYMNEFDQLVKHKLKVKYYVRYADDFVILSQDKFWLEELLSKLADFLSERLKLEMHPDKVFIKTLASGVDFLGWVHFPDHRVLRTTTKRRMLKKIKENPTSETTNSYLGLLKHGNTHKLKNMIKSGQ
ncbi:MAG: reverse transcriptase domain-containing protein [Candidatus Paceibacterota bacterium]